MKKIIYCSTLLLLTSVDCFGQKDVNIRPSLQLEPKSDETASGRELWEKIEGTYQFVVYDDNYQVLLTKNLYDLVIKSRKADADVRIKIDDKTELYLPSTNSITSGSFVKLEPILISE